MLSFYLRILHIYKILINLSLHLLLLFYLLTGDKNNLDFLKINYYKYKL